MSHNTQGISTARQKAAAAKWQGPKHPKSTKGLQMRRPFTSSQCFNRRNYKPNLSRWHHLKWGQATSLTLQQVCLFCRATLAGGLPYKNNWNFKGHCRPISDQQQKYIYCFTNAFQSNCFTLDRNTLDQSNIDDNYHTELPFSLGMQTPIPVAVNAENGTGKY